MDINKLIKIIESCRTYEQLENLQHFIDTLLFDSVSDCEKIKTALIDQGVKILKQNITNENEN